MTMHPIFDLHDRIPAFAKKVTSGVSIPHGSFSHGSQSARFNPPGRKTGPLPPGVQNMLPNVRSKPNVNPPPLPDLSEGSNSTFRSKAKKGAAPTQRNGSLSAKIAGQKLALAGIKAINGSSSMGGPPSMGGTTATPQGSRPAPFDGPGPQSGSLAGNTQGGGTVGPGPRGKGRLVF